MKEDIRTSWPSDAQESPFPANMSWYSFKKGILDPKCWQLFAIVVQQTNCIGTWPAGLARAVSEELPYVCPYRRRDRSSLWKFAAEGSRPDPGTIEVYGPDLLPHDDEVASTVLPKYGPMVVNFHAQWELGPAGKYNRIPCPAKHGGEDSEQNRLRWFRKCLSLLIMHLAANRDLTSVAFPF